MLSTTTVKKSALTVAGLGALALGGAAVSGAADNGTSSGSSSSGTRPPDMRPDREPLSADAAAKVKAAALDKVSGATVLRTEAGGPYSTPYHAHIRTSDGKRRVVFVNGDFEATAVQADRGPRGRGPGGHGRFGGPGPGAGEKPLTGDTKEQVEDAVTAKYPGATIIRTETNGDSAAPYESHIQTSDGKELEILVSKDFEVVDAREHPAHP